MEGHSKTSKERERRLYKTGFLLRDYNFSLDEIPFSNDGNLDIDKDPKLAEAKANPERFPVEINKANFHQLIRVPGIGLKSAKRILNYRAKNKIHYFEELKGIGVSLKRASSFILIDGKLPEPYQTELWSE